MSNMPYTEGPGLSRDVQISAKKHAARFGASSLVMAQASPMNENRRVLSWENMTSNEKLVYLGLVIALLGGAAYGISTAVDGNHGVVYAAGTDTVLGDSSYHVQSPVIHPAIPSPDRREPAVINKQTPTRSQKVEAVKPEPKQIISTPIAPGVSKGTPKAGTLYTQARGIDNQPALVTDSATEYTVLAKDSLPLPKEMGKVVDSVRDLLIKHSIKVLVVEDTSPLLLEEGVLKAAGRAYLDLEGLPTAVVSDKASPYALEHEIAHLFDPNYNRELGSVVNGVIKEKLMSYYRDMLADFTARFLIFDRELNEENGDPGLVNRYRNTVNDIGRENYQLFVQTVPPEILKSLSYDNEVINGQLLAQWYEAGGSEVLGSGVGEQAIDWLMRNATQTDYLFFNPQVFGSYLLLNRESLDIEPGERQKVEASISKHFQNFYYESVVEQIRLGLFYRGEGLNGGSAEIIRDLIGEF